MFRRLIRSLLAPRPVAPVRRDRFRPGFEPLEDRLVPFSPYTHLYAADLAVADIQADNTGTITGREYAVRPAGGDAIRACPDVYAAGTVGSDGFPDPLVGQSSIHPTNTGQWLSHILNAAWDAQRDGSPYTPEQRGQILAFAYGYLTHAAGDMWAH